MKIRIVANKMIVELTISPFLFEVLTIRGRFVNQQM
jgi:hypothetical protein